LAESLGEALGLEGNGRLLDVACGPGTITLRVAHRFEEVVGLDPDPGMIAEARRLAARGQVTNARWVQERAEALPAGLGTFRVITFGASFHWMDRPKVATVVRSMLEPDGGVVQVGAPAYRVEDLRAEHAYGDLPHPPPPDAEIEALRRRYLGADRRAGRSIRNTSPSGEDEVFRAAGFPAAREVTVPDQRVMERTIDDLVANCLSSSGTAPHLFGGRLPRFEADLRALLGRASSSGLFSVRLPDNILRIWTRPEDVGGR